MLLEYKHIIKPKLKYTYLSIDEDGTLIIKSPKVSKTYINHLLIKKSKWINSAKEKIANKKAKIGDIFYTNKMYLWGDEYEVKLYTNSKSLYKIEDKTITIYYKDIENIEHIIYDIYKQEAKQYIPLLIKELSQKMNLYPKQISFRRTKRQWGSCSANNNISLNTMLAKLPKDVVQYVIIHELAHIKYKNHQQEFWTLVAKYEPRYKQLRKELNLFHTI